MKADVVAAAIAATKSDVYDGIMETVLLAVYVIGGVYYQ